jgi:hypothetical protein
LQNKATFEAASREKNAGLDRLVEGKYASYGGVMKKASLTIKR